MNFSSSMVTVFVVDFWLSWKQKEFSQFLKGAFLDFPRKFISLVYHACFKTRLGAKSLISKMFVALAYI